jgi:hypothetical protein
MSISNVVQQGREIFPSENQLLLSVHREGKPGAGLKGPLDIQSEYVEYIFNSFLKRGLVKRDWLGKYQLTEHGRQRIISRPGS